MQTIERPGDYVNGQFAPPASVDGELEIRSPADTEDRVAIHPYATSQVDAAVQAATEAFGPWRRRTQNERAELLRRYQQRLREHAEEFAQLIAREVGKPLWDARTEARALLAKVDIMLGEGAQWTADRKLDDISGEMRFRPHGVCAVLGPFNFPAHLPNGQIVPALLLGNTVVFKPSDKAPSAGWLLARCMEEAGFPKGVFNLVQGDASVGQKLTEHDGVDAIFFTGSAPVGKQIVKANADRPGRMLALELGGKNASIVLDDGDLDAAVRQLAFSAYATAGQRCTATSRVFATRGIADRLLQQLAHAANRAVIGYPLDEGVFSGPLIAEAARDRLASAIQRARKAGFEAIAEGGAFQVKNHRGWYVRPSVHRAPEPNIRVDGYTHDELFGPDLAVYIVEDLDQAIELANSTRYGLAAAVFTASKEAFEHAADRLRVGVLNWNRSTAGASGRLPFGGIKDSGNQRPAGVTAGTFCAYPQSLLCAPDGSGPASWPGLFDG